MEEQANPLDAEFALADALDYIFSHLKLRDLLNVCRVCKSWHAAAVKEITCRRSPESLIIPHIYGKEPTYNDKLSNTHIHDLLTAKPQVALLFVGPSKRERGVPDKNLESKIIAEYRKLFPHFLVTVGVDDCLMDDIHMNCCPGLLGPPNGIPGLFLPNYRDLSIKVLSTPEISGCVDFQSLEPSIKSRNTIIFFSRPYGQESLLKGIQKKFKPKTFTLWGGAFDDSLEALNCTSACANDDTRQNKVNELGIFITGSCHDSWSIMIDCLIERTAVDRQLSKFSDQLKLRRRSICLACGPRYVAGRQKTEQDYSKMYMNNFQLRDAVKRVLPDIPFVGIFNYGYHPHFGVDSSSEDPHQRMAQPMALSLMVLTFD